MPSLPPRAALRTRHGLAALLALGLLLATSSLRAETDGQQPVDSWELCGRHLVEAERLLKVPRLLLTAIAKSESGRWNAARQANLAWPWTVTAEGRGRYLPSREAAIREVEALRARGIRNIDVGCMQINLYYHPKAFDSLEQAFDPAFNIAYGATFLTDLRGKLRSWTRAVGRYHSATPQFANRYRAKVYAAWRAEKKAARAAKRAELLARRAQLAERR